MYVVKKLQILILQEILYQNSYGFDSVANFVVKQLQTLIRSKFCRKIATNFDFVANVVARQLWTSYLQLIMQQNSYGFCLHSKFCSKSAIEFDSLEFRSKIMMDHNSVASYLRTLIRQQNSIVIQLLATTCNSIAKQLQQAFP